MARYNRFMGEYNENTTYEKGDVVTFDGAAYYRKMPGSGISPIARKKPYTVWSRLNEDLSTIFPLGGGGGGTGTGLPSDVGAYKYMATDGNGEWVAADRLGWKEASSVIVYENENPDWDLTGQDISDNSGYMIPRVNLNVYSSEVDVLEAGKYYNVTINGKTYKNLLCVEGNEWEDGLPARFIGNMAFVNDSIGSVPVTDDNGVPFCIGSCEWKLEVRYQFTEAEAFDGHGEWPTAADIMDSVALKIESVSETIHPIPAEYLPHITFYQSPQSEGFTMSCNLSLEECLKLYNNALESKTGLFPSATFVMNHPNGKQYIVYATLCYSDEYYDVEDNESIALYFEFVIPDTGGETGTVAYTVEGIITQ